MRRRGVELLAVLALFTLFTAMAAPMLAKTIELDAATIADINAAFDAGTLTEPHR